MAVKTEKITFPGSQGHLLSARLDSPDGEVKGYALFVHCFTCSSNILAASHISTALTEKGIAVFRFDFTGLGSSEGEFSNTNFSSNIEDIKAAIDFLRTQNKTPQILIGHSLGGSAVLRAAEMISDLKALVTINAPSDPNHLRHLLNNSIEEITSQGYANVLLAGRTFQIQKQFIDDLEKHKSLDYLKDVKAALLIFHSPQDKMVDIENAKLIFTAARHPKNFISLYGADHLLTKIEDADYVADVISSWANRYMSETKEKDENSQGVTVTEIGDGKFAQVVHAAGHTFFVDEPVDAGGDNRGPSPYDLILASLGACTSITLRLYAEHKNIPLKGVKVTLNHEKIYNEDLVDCVETNARLDLINREITVTGDLTQEQKDGLFRISEKCPVHKTLSQPSVIKTSLKTEKS